MGGGERRIAGEGSLYSMVRRLAAMPNSSHRGYRISLPDRAVAPFAYEPKDFDDLILAVPRNRF
jgi:hypothetical protein